MAGRPRTISKFCGSQVTPHSTKPNLDVNQSVVATTGQWKHVKTTPFHDRLTGSQNLLWTTKTCPSIVFGRPSRTAFEAINGRDSNRADFLYSTATHELSGCARLHLFNNKPSADLWDARPYSHLGPMIQVCNWHQRSSGRNFFQFLSKSELPSFPFEVIQLSTQKSRKQLSFDLQNTSKPETSVPEWRLKITPLTINNQLQHCSSFPGSDCADSAIGKFRRRLVSIAQKESWHNSTNQHPQSSNRQKKEVQIYSAKSSAQAAGMCFEIVGNLTSVVPVLRGCNFDTSQFTNGQNGGALKLVVFIWNVCIFEDFNLYLPWMVLTKRWKRL